jgi:hypothetical protein
MDGELKYVGKIILFLAVMFGVVATGYYIMLPKWRAKVAYVFWGRNRR